MARVRLTLALSVVAALVIASAITPGRAQAPASGAEESEAKAGATKKKNPAKKADQTKAGEKGRDPAATEKSLDQAQKSLDAGKADIATNQVNSVISAGGLDSRSMARALAIRGHAHKKQGKPAQAIADLQSALYLRNGLNDAERAAATQARSEAYREAGLGEPAPANQSAAAAQQAPATSKETASSARSAKQAASKADAGAQAQAPASSPMTTAAVQPPRPAQPEQPAATPSGGGIGGFFSNLFGGSSSQPQTPPAAAAPARGPSETAVSSWSEAGPGTAGSAKAKASPKTAAAPAPPDAKATPQKTATLAKGGFRIELAAVKSREEAKRTAEKVRKEHASIIGQRSYSIVEATFGNMGTFYRAQFGPYDESVEPRALCATLRSTGLDCQVMGN